ncbi:MAG: SRPBCC family protein [Chloroflexi bacterium]|nr:SRPBCC family protein [Chloroflexota bacterium]
MARLDLKLEVKAPVSMLFRAVTDPETVQHWMPDLLDWQVVEGEPPEIGSSFQETRRMGKRSATEVFEVTAYLRDKEYAVRGYAQGVDTHTSYAFQPAGGGASQVDIVLFYRWQGLWGLVGPLMKPMLRRYLQKDLEALKGYVEGQRR